ncbi:MAG: IS1634 family transposase [Bacteroidetes bacterium]|nr:MAG: IS1634 family transposase [Bacteroidota bacterium]
MNEKIYPKIIKGKTYYYLQYTYRVKINPNDIMKGKGRGSGKSKVKSKSVYLGSASAIKKKLSTLTEPLEIKYKEFGLVGAVYNVAKEIGLIETFKNNIKGERYGIENWKYFLLAIINRIDNSTSIEKMGKLAEETILPELLNFQPQKLNSKSFWYATDDIIREKELNDRRNKNPEIIEEINAGIDEQIFIKIEKEIVKNIQDKYELFSDVFLYDTTNFFTFFKEPLRSFIAKSAKSKAGRNNLKHTGLALCVDKQWGVPMFHSIYRANSHDTKTFNKAIDDLIHVIKDVIKVENMMLVIDKGNNSKDNFEKLVKKTQWIGSLKVSDYQDLSNIELKDYSDTYKEYKYITRKKHVMGVDMKLVLTYNDKLYRKQKKSFNASIEKLTNKITKKWSEYKRTPSQVPKGVTNILSDSHYGKYIGVRCKKGKAEFFDKTKEVDKKKKKFGKTLLFASNNSQKAYDIIDLYHSKDKVEDGIKLLKDPHLISWQPMRHWTDTKIRAFAFSCVMALMIIRIMEYKATINDIKMSPQILKQELKDLKKVILIYDKNRVQKKITHTSTVQKRLWEVFNLDDIKT